MNRLLQVRTKIKGKTAPKTIIERLESYIARALEFFRAKITGTHEGQAADFKLNRLVEQLVDIEAKKKHTLKQEEAQDKAFFSPVEEFAKATADKALVKAGELLNAKVITESSSAVVRAAGCIR